MKGDGEDAAQKAACPPEARLPYEKPCVTWEQPLEAKPSLMAGCAKLPGQSGPCSQVGPHSS